jgi:hypothetical protein
MLAGSKRTGNSPDRVENEVGGKKVEQNAGRILPYNVWCILTVKGRLDVTLLFSSLLRPSLLSKSTPMSSVGYWEVIVS